jgi:arylsulfatase A-like enzyme
MRVLSLVAGIALLLPATVAAETKRPNVVVIITDDQRWDTLSLAGHPHLKTPNIDRIGKEGVWFKNAFCTTSLCSPSRASMLSGMYAHGHKVRNNFTEYPPTLPSLASVLQALGYATGYVGKWHMGEENDAKRPGFDYWVSHKGQGKYHDTEFNIDGTRKTVAGYYTHVVTDLAIDWLKKQEKGKPFLLMMGHKAPHSFYVPEPRYKNLFDHVKVDYPKSAFQLEGKPSWIKLRQETWHGIYGPLFEFRKQFPDTRPEAVSDFERMIRAYWATIKSVDDSVGRILQTLEEQGILDDTIVVFVSDNGLLNGEFGMVDKRTMHEPSIRVPMLVRYPGLTPTKQPRTVEGMVLHIDLAPSLLDLCAAEPLPGAHGKSWKKLAQGDRTGWRTSFLYEYDYEKQFPYTPNIRGVRTDRWAYMRYPHGDGAADRHLAELYDVQSDPDQRQNRISDPTLKETVERLQQELNRLLAESGVERDVMPLDEGIKKELPDLKIR